MQDSKYEFTYTECNKMSKVHAQVSRVYGLFWLTNQMWFSVVCCAWSLSMTHIIVDKSTDNTKPHSICFLSQCQRQRKWFFFRAWPRACQIDANSVVWTLIDNGKLANQIARLLANMVKLVVVNDNERKPKQNDFGNDYRIKTIEVDRISPNLTLWLHAKKKTLPSFLNLRWLT